MSTTNESSTSAFSNSNDAYLFSLESKVMEKFYVISSNLPSGRILSGFTLLFSLIQTCLLGFNHTFNFGFYTNQVSKYFGYASRQWIFDEYDYSVFQVIMGVSLSFTLIVMFYFIYFINQEHFNWSSSLELLAASMLFIISHGLYVPLLGIFLTAFECDYSTLKLSTYTQISCFLYPNDVSLAFCSMGLVMIMGISIYPQIFFVDRFHKNNFFSSSDNRFFLMLLLYQTLISFMNALIPLKYISTSFGFLSSLFMILYLLRYLPFFKIYVNYFYGIAFCFGLTFNLTALLSDSTFNLFDSDISSLFLFSIVIFALVFSILFGLRILFLHLKIKATKKREKKETGFIAQLLEFFYSPQDVDVEAHYALTMFGFEKSCIIFENELAQNVTSSRLKIFYILFLLEQKSENATEILSKINNATKELSKMNFSFFILPDTKYLKQYCLQKRIETSLAQNLGEENGKIALELRKADKSKRNYFYWICKYWRCIETGKFKPYQLSAAVASINHYEKKCDFIFQTLLLDFPNNVSVLRTYGEYIEDVKYQHSRADLLYDNANRLEDIQSKIGFKSSKNDTLERLKNRIKMLVQKKEKVDHVAEVTEEKEMEEIPVIEDVPELDELNQYKMEVIRDNPSSLNTSSVLNSSVIMKSPNSPHRLKYSPHKTPGGSPAVKFNDLDDDNYSESIIERMKRKRSHDSQSSDHQMHELMKDTSLPEEEVDFKQTKAERLFRQYKKEEIQNESPISFLGFIIVLILFFLVAVASISVAFIFCFTELTYIQNSIPIVREVGDSRTAAVSLSYYSRELQLNHGMGNQTQNLIHLKHHRNVFSTEVLKVYEHTLRKERIYPIWSNEKLLLLNRTIGNTNFNLIDGHLLLVSKSEMMTNESFFDENTAENDEIFFFVNVNGALKYPSALESLMEGIKQEEFVDHALLFIYCGICMIVIIISILLAAISMCILFCYELSFHRLAYSIKEDRIKKIVAKYSKLSGNDSNIDIEKKKEMFPLFVTLFFKLLVIFFLGIFIITIFMILFGITQNSSKENIQEVDFAGRRVYEMIQIQFRLLEMESKKSFFDSNQNKNMLQSSYKLFDLYHHALRYGNPDFGISGSDGVILEMDQLYYRSACSNNSNIDCLSLQQLLILIDKGISSYLDDGTSASERTAVYQELKVQIGKSISILEKSLDLYTTVNKNLFSGIDAINQISFIVGIAVFISLYFIFFFSSPFQFRDEILRKKKLLLDLSIQEIYSSKVIQEYLISRKIGKDLKHEKRYNSLLNNSYYSVIEFSDDFTVNNANHAATQLFETPYTLLIGTNIKKLFDKLALKSILNFSLSNDNFLNIDVQAIKTQKKLLIQINLSIIKVLGENNSNTYIAFIQDISELLNQEKLLKFEKEKTEKLLLNIFPKAIVEQKMLMDNSETIVDTYDNCSIIFSDMVNFTAKSSAMNPEEIVKFLNEIFESFDDICEKYGVEKIKTIGDCYMAVAGVPNLSNEHAHQIMDFAIELHEIIDRYNEKHNSEIQFRTGINSGKVIAGVIGKRKFCFDIWGDQVNIASRMESTGIPSKIQVSASTHELLKDHYEFEERGEINVKGKGKMQTWIFKQKKALEIISNSDEEILLEEEVIGNSTPEIIVQDEILKKNENEPMESQKVEEIE
eukprot:gene8956-905_t